MLVEKDFGVQDIWHWDEWPDKRIMTNLPAGDTGIDLVATTTTGERVAIQCKNYESSHRVGVRDIATFLSASDAIRADIEEEEVKCFSYLWLVTVNEWTRNAEGQLKALGKAVRRIDLNQYGSVELPIGDSVRAVREPLPFQEKAIDLCTEGLTTNHHPRGRLTMACGTGKTFTSLRITESICKKLSSPGLVLFLAPSIALVSQARREWLNYTNEVMKPLVVCSDSYAGGKREDISLTDLACTVTTDPGEIASFSSTHKDELRVIFCTYHSLHRIVEAQIKHGLGAIDLTIADEAHRTTGLIKETDRDEKTTNFQLVHDGDQLNSSRRLYMTATPRVYTHESRLKASEKGAQVVDMGGPESREFYGPELYRLGFKDAVALEQLSDYRVIVFGVQTGLVTAGARREMSDIDVKTTARSRRMVPSLQEMTRVLGTSLAINGHYRVKDDESAAIPLTKCLAYANSIPRSLWYRDALIGPQVKSFTTRKLTGEKRALSVVSEHLDASSNSLQRNQALDKLRNADKNDEIRVINNVRLFTEGVDVPNLDAVIFLDPRDSQVDIVQAVGRVMRKAEGKKYGYIVIPVVLPETGDWEEALAENSEGYKTIGRVLRALQSHDGRLAEHPEEFLSVIHIDPDGQSPDPDGGGGGTGGGGTPPGESIFDGIEPVAEHIFAKVVVSSKLGNPGRLIADQIQSTVKYAAKVLDESGVSEQLASALDISFEKEEDKVHVCTVAALLLCNACLMHKRIRDNVLALRFITTLDRINGSRDPLEALSMAWEGILNFDYKPIFEPALVVLNVLRVSTSSSEKALHPLIECANSLSESMSELGYDHAGPLYHKILPTASSDGAYYTNNLSALLLAQLALDELSVNWEDLDEVRSLRIIDPACGTGTLLMAVCRFIKERAAKAIDMSEEEIEELHKHLVENSICGLDINRHAIQLAASNLTIGASAIDYEKMNFMTMKHGLDQTGQAHLGSLELLRSESGLDAQLSPLNSLADLREGGYSDSPTGSFPTKNINLVIMNPPFTNNVKRGQKYDADTVQMMRKRERTLVLELDALEQSAYDSNSISTLFSPLADRLLESGSGSVFAAVMSYASTTAPSVIGTRRLWLERFNIDTVITSHDPRRPNFSENTSITESLLIFRRKEPSEEVTPTRFVSIKKMPNSIDEVESLYFELCEAKRAAMSTKSWSQMFWSRERLEQDDWTPAALSSETLVNSNLLLNKRKDQLVKLGSVASVEPAGVRVSDGFTKSEEDHGYYALWDHKSDREATLSSHPDRFIRPKNDKEAYADHLWTKRSYLLIANRISTTSNRLVSVHTDQQVLGCAWVPVLSESELTGVSKALCCYLNSSYVFVQFLANRSKKLTYGHFSLETLRSLLVPNLKTIDLEPLAELFEEIKDNEVLPFHQMNQCETRKSIDHAVAEVMVGDPTESDEIRELICQEPTVNQAVVYPKKAK